MVHDDTRFLGGDPTADSTEGDVDESATADAREEIRADRDDLSEFDYGPLPDYDELSEQIAAERREFDDRE